MRVRAKLHETLFKLDDDKYVNKMSRQSGTPRDPLFIHCIDRIHTNVKVYIYPPEIVNVWSLSIS